LDKTEQIVVYILKVDYTYQCLEIVDVYSPIINQLSE